MNILFIPFVHTVHFVHTGIPLYLTRMCICCHFDGIIEAYRQNGIEACMVSGLHMYTLTTNEGVRNILFLGK